LVHHILLDKKQCSKINDGDLAQCQADNIIDKVFYANFEESGANKFGGTHLAGILRKHIIVDITLWLISISLVEHQRLFRRNLDALCVVIIDHRTDADGDLVA
jgi:hypothetical protein